MAWNGSGVFSRIHNWVTDRDAAIKILASRHDAEDDNFATGIQACITKDNQSKPTADFAPNADATYSLGTSTVKWINAFLSGALKFVGTNFTTTVAYTDPTANRTVTLPDATGTVALTASPAFTGTPTAPTQSAGDNSTAIATTAYVDTLPYQHGQCKLALNGANLELTPYNGNRLIINGNVETVPASTTLAPSGLSATTLYYIYAYMSGGTLTLEASVTAYATHTDGVTIKSGDATRTLVGMAYVKTAATFADTVTQRFVLSYFNRRNKELYVSPSSRSTTSGTQVEITVSAERLEFITWADEAVYGSLTSVISNDTGGQSMDLSYRVDGTTLIGGTGRNYTLSAAEVSCPTLSGFITVSEGYRYLAVFGSVSGGTGTLLGGGYSKSQASIKG